MLVCEGALLRCPFGNVSTPLNLTRQNNISGTLPYANVNDHIPIHNIVPFGMCSSMMNPTVAAAMAATSGILTPMPCMPVTNSAWTNPSEKVEIDNAKAITVNSRLYCIWGGLIEVSFPGYIK